jgi:hypothetical protein
MASESLALAEGWRKLDGRSAPVTSMPTLQGETQMTRTTGLFCFVLGLSAVMPALAGAAPVSEEKKAKCRLEAQSAFPGPGNQGKRAIMGGGEETQAKRRAYVQDCLKKP